jgi:hypothetical protein
MNLADELMRQCLHDPFPVHSRWFAAKSHTDGPVQHLAQLCLLSWHFRYPFSISIEEADLEERYRLVSDVLNTQKENVTVLTDSTPAGLYQNGFEQPVVSVNRNLDEAWLVGSFRVVNGAMPKRAVGSWKNSSDLINVQFPRVAILLDTDDRDMSHPSWRRVIRCRMNVSDAK